VEFHLQDDLFETEEVGAVLQFSPSPQTLPSASSQAAMAVHETDETKKRQILEAAIGCKTLTCSFLVTVRSASCEKRRRKELPSCKLSLGSKRKTKAQQGTTVPTCRQLGIINLQQSTQTAELHCTEHCTQLGNSRQPVTIDTRHQQTHRIAITTANNFPFPPIFMFGGIPETVQQERLSQRQELCNTHTHTHTRTGNLWFLSKLGREKEAQGVSTTVHQQGFA